MGKGRTDEYPRSYDAHQIQREQERFATAGIEGPRCVNSWHRLGTAAMRHSSELRN